MAEVLAAPLEPGFDYTRSLGATLSRFMTALRECRIEGVRGSDGRVHVPPPEYDPYTAAPLTEFVEVGQQGAVLTWSWMPDPIEGQPLQHPFAWALIRLDGADTPLLHAVDAGEPGRMRSGMRVAVRWADERVGHIRDIACFDPVSEEASMTAPTEPSTRSVTSVQTQVITPIQLHYMHAAAPQETGFLRALTEGRLVGARCPECQKVYIPPRGACPVDGVPTDEEVELSDQGTVTTFCIVNVPFMGQHIKPPYVSAYVLLDGADIPFLHLILGCPVEEVRMGMRVQAVWRPREEWGYTLQNIDHFRPIDEPDTPYESYAHHL